MTVIIMFYQYTVFSHNKLSSISQSINVQSENLQKLLRYLSGIETSMFKVVAVSHGGR